MIRTFPPFRISVALLSFLVLLGVASAAVFPDVPDGHIYQEEVEMLVGAQVINGNPDGSFYPDRTVNRAEMLKMLYKAVGMAPDPLSVRCFKDVEIGGWYESFVCDAAARRFVAGYSDGTFRPADPVNRVEALKMITLIFELNVEEVRDEDRDVVKFVDVSTAAWYTKYLYAAFAKGILPIEGQDGARFYPDWPLLRGEAAAYIYNALNVDLQEERESMEKEVEEEEVSASSSQSSVQSSVASSQPSVPKPTSVDRAFPFSHDGKFSAKQSFSYRFTMTNPRVVNVSVRLQPGQPGSVTCRLYLLNENGFSDQYYLGYQEGNTCSILASLSSGSYQLQLQPSKADTTFSVSTQPGSGDGNDGFNQAKKVHVDIMNTEVLTSNDLEDWYTFTVSAEQQMLVELTNSANLRCIVYAMSDVDLYGFSGPSCNQSYTYPPGTYYVSVGRKATKSAQQTYTLGLRKK